MTRLILALIATTAIVVAGCGSSSNDAVTGGGSSTTPSGGAASTTGGGSAPSGGGSSNPADATKPPSATNSGSLPPKVGRVSLQGSKFVPKTITVKKGQKILWQNDDPFNHDVTAAKGATFKSGILAAGETYTYTPKKTGTITYRSKLQRGMTGTIVVK